MSGGQLKARSRLRPGLASRMRQDRLPGLARRRLAVATAVAGALAMIAACSGGGAHQTAAARPAASPPGSSAPVIRLVVPPGPVQNGNVSPRQDWVTPFEKRTGCQVDLHNAGTDAQAVHDLIGGGTHYSGILADPEVAGQVLAAKAVQPLKTSRIAGYKRLSARLRAAPTEVSHGQVYGIPYIWDSYATGYDPGRVKPAPRAWAALFSPASAARYGGKIILPGSAATIGLAALYLRSARPALGITDPFELTGTQFRAAVRAVQSVSRDVGTWWTQDSAVIGQLGDGQDVLGGVMTHQIAEMARAGLPATGVPTAATAAASGGTVAYLDSWMMSAQAPNQECMYKWLSWTASPPIQERAAAWTGSAPASPAGCTGPASPICAQFHESSLPSASGMAFEHLPVSDCGDGRTGCAGYGQWLGAWQGIAPGTDTFATPSATPSAG